MAEARGSILSSECVSHYVDSIQSSMDSSQSTMNWSEIKILHLKLKDEAIAKV